MQYELKTKEIDKRLIQLGQKLFLARAGFEPRSKRIFIFLIRNSLKPYPLGYKLPCKSFWIDYLIISCSRTCIIFVCVHVFLSLLKWIE